MADRYRQGTVTAGGDGGTLAAEARGETQAWRDAMEVFALERAAAAAYRLIDRANEFIAESEPWALAKDAAKAAELDRVLWDASEALRVATVMLAPFMPRSTTEILRRLGDGAPDARALEWRATGSRVIEKGANLWPRIETEETTVTDENPKPEPEMVPGVTPAAGTHSPQQPAADAPAPGTAPAAAPSTAKITIDDFMKVDLRVAKVLAAERVPKSKKLIKLTLDLGFEQRTLAAGIAEAYEPDALVGRHVVIVANLEPRAIMGIESNGMVLAASPDGGKPTLIGFDVPPDLGSRVR
jgi:methionyl-tRNA synthetase